MPMHSNSKLNQLISKSKRADGMSKDVLFLLYVEQILGKQRKKKLVKALEQFICVALNKWGENRHGCIEVMVLRQFCACILPERSVCGCHTKPKLGHSERDKERKREGLKQTPIKIQIFT